jgi:hypothetical protein
VSRQKYATIRNNVDSPEHDLPLPALRAGLGQAHARNARALREVQDALLEHPRGQAPDGQAPEEREEGHQMNGDSQYSIDLDRDLYDQIMALPNLTTDVEEFVHEATRFLILIRSESGEETSTKATAQEERLVATFLRFIRRADPILVSMVTHGIEQWRKRERVNT